MSSLRERIDLLERDLAVTPRRTSVHRDLPIAVFRYDPADEWELRGEVKRLATRLEATHARMHMVSLADLLWQSIEESEGIDTLVEYEREYGFAAAQEQVTTYLSDGDFRPLPDLLTARLAPFDPDADIVFLMQASAMAPAIYPMSRLVEEMYGRSRVPTILFYPGSLEGDTGLRFMNLREREATGSYRVKIYG